jgi:hypothetical protein
MMPDPESDEYRNKIRTVFVWFRRCWWYKLAHVCRQWRNLILESPFRLDLHLYCTNGVPIADMLVHSPPLPLSISYDVEREIEAEDESGIRLALSHRDRVRNIFFWILDKKLLTVMDDQFPDLERIYISGYSRIEMALPVTFQAPNLRHLKLSKVYLPIRSTLLTTATRLVTLELLDIPASAYFPPSYILTRLSLMVQLEKLTIAFKVNIPNRDIERKSQTPDMITLPNLRRFAFIGVSTYLEGLVARISAPSLSTFRAHLFPQHPFTFPGLFQFMQAYENLTFTTLQVTFCAYTLSLDPLPWKRHTPLMLKISCRHDLNWPVASTVQFFGALSPVLSVVEKVTFNSRGYDESSRWYNDIDRRQWRELLRPFINARAIRVHDNLISNISRSLPSDDGEPPLELLPNLEEVGYSGESDARDAFTTFLKERQVSGHPVSLRLVDRSMFDRPRDLC